MPRPKFWELPEPRRRHLLDIAGRHFAAHGPRGASLNAILTEANVAKGVAYYYFDDKADLFATVLEDAWDELAPLTPAADAPLWPGLEVMYHAHLAILRRRPWLATLARHEPPEAVAARLAPIAAHLAALWARVQGSGIRDDLPPELVAAMVRGLDEAIDRWWADHPEATAAEASAAFAILKATIRGGVT
jgi:AcrR family transcriptional regulator